jgi:hypothetical protein
MVVEKFFSDGAIAVMAEAEGEPIGANGSSRGFDEMDCAVDALLHLAKGRPAFLQAGEIPQAVPRGFDGFVADVFVHFDSRSSALRPSPVSPT